MKDIFEATLNCDVTVTKRHGETGRQAIERLSGLMDSELCHLADHDVSVRRNVDPVPFWYGTPAGPVAVMAVSRADADSLLAGSAMAGSGSFPMEPDEGMAPVWTGWSKAALGALPAGFGDLYLYVPDRNQLVYVSEGTGDNLLPEDADEGFVDYVNYQLYDLDGGIGETDGGMVMFRHLVQDRFDCLGEAVPDVLKEAYGDSLHPFVLIGGNLLKGPKFTT